jgi:UDP-N-acetylglucosamine--N-acetylmuramyl-(pentapeptide) pyrophosphoryl-undecaprenol N-acetylglucosamine transferase
MALAGKKRQSLLYVPDIEPGLALKVLARYSDRIAITSEESRKFFKHQEKLTVSGYPIREELKKWNKADGLAYFKFDPNLKTVLFMGGSSGARSINNAVVNIAGKLIERYQVIHLTGHLDWDSLRHQTDELGPRYQAFPYLHEMGAALAAADLVVSRAGASVLGEYAHFGLPAILVPYPYAWQYQKVNADYLVERGAAVLLEDEKLEKELYSTVTTLLEDPKRLAQMSQAMAALAQPAAAEKIAELLLEMAGNER